MIFGFQKVDPEYMESGNESPDSISFKRVLSQFSGDVGIFVQEREYDVLSFRR